MGGAAAYCLQFGYLQFRLDGVETTKNKPERHHPINAHAALPLTRDTCTHQVGVAETAS